MAPESVNEQSVYSTESDCWSIGVIAYTLLSGKLPFQSDEKGSLMDEIEAAKYEWTKEFHHISEDARSFVWRILKKEPE